MIKPADQKLAKVAGKELYRMVKDGATVDIGGLDDDSTFYPEAMSSKWNGECWLKISHADKLKIKKDKKAKTKDLGGGNIEVEIDVDGTGRKHRFRQGSLEWDIEYSSVDDLPSDDIERFTLEFPYDQLSWHHQPALTQEEIDDGHFRPENVINSYAGYFDKSNNEYETGKFCHIYRSKMVANDGSETWVNQEIINNELVIDIPRQWCVDHGFPVVLDPNFGYESVGGTTSSFNTNATGLFTPASNGSAISVFVALNATGYKVTGGIYSDSSTYPNARLMDSAEADSLSTGFTECPLDSSLSVSAGTNYWICSRRSGTFIRFDSLSGKFAKYSNTTYSAGVLPDPWPAGQSSASNTVYSMYVYYDESLLPINFNEGKPTFSSNGVYRKSFSPKIFKKLLFVSESTPSKTINVSLGLVQVTKYTPLVSLGKTVNLNLGTIQVTGYNPLVSLGKSITCNLGTVQVSKYNPTVQKIKTIETSLGTIFVTGYPVTISNIFEVNCSLGSIGITGYNPSIQKTKTIDLSLGTVQISKYNPTVQTIKEIKPNLGVIQLTGYNPSIQKTKTIEVPLSTLSIIGYPPNISFDKNITPNLGVIQLTGYNPSILSTKTINAQLKTIQISKYNPIVITTSIIPTPKSRIYLIEKDNRVYNIEKDNRVYSITS